MAEQKHGVNARAVLTAVVAVTITAFAFYLLHHFTIDISLDDVIADIRNTRDTQFLLAILATFISFVAIACYEILAVRTIAPGKISPATAAWAGVAGFAISDVAGFHVLTGGALRYRVYSRKGLEIGPISQIVALSWMSLWLGMLFLIGCALAFYPGGILAMQAMPADVVSGIGYFILSLFGLYFLWVATGSRTVSIRGLHLQLPRLPTSLMQLFAGVVDIAASAAALYFLLPADIAGSASGYFVIYISAVILGAVSHSPGGLGVFEATFMAGLGAVGRPDVLGALVLYRVIYYFLPLVPVALTLLFLEVAGGRRAIGQSVRELGKASEPLIPPLVAGLTFVGGLILLFSGSLPASTIRHEWIRLVLPLPFVESTHLLASLVGVALLVISHGLIRRRQSAFKLAIALLGTGAVFALTKGLDYEEAAILAVIIILLVPFRSAFYRTSGVCLFAVTPFWLGVIAITIGAAVWLGFFSYRHVAYSDQLWWAFSWKGDAPRFLRAAVTIVAALFALGLYMILNRRSLPIVPRDHVPDSVRHLVAQSPMSDATVALLGDKHFLVSEDESAFLMYGVCGGSYIAKGDPVGDAKQGAALAWRFREMADQGGYRAAFYSVGPENLPLYLDMGLSVLKIGEIARVALPDFTLETPQHKDLRYARRRAPRDGLEFSILPKEEVSSFISELEAVSDAWLAIKSGSEKQFALGNFRENYLVNFDFAIVRHEGKIVAFANILASGQHEEMSIDLMRYRPNISSVLMDFLFAELLLYGQEQGYRWFNLGAAPLAGLSDHRLATSWNHIGTMIYQRGEDFYHFEGLRAYKEKFDPVWSPHYLACTGGFALPKVLFDITALISGGPMKVIKR